MEIKSNIFNTINVEYLEDSQYIKSNTDTCKSKLLLFKYGLPEEDWSLPEDVKNIIIDKNILLEIQLQKFLRLVAEGEQDQAEAMLQENPGLNLLSGDVTDLSKRSFNNITGFQYAVWALDFHMWTMLRKYLKPEDMIKQLQAVETGSWVKEHGKLASWQNLIDALDTYINLCNQSNWDEAAKQWNRAVGDAQQQLPVHVVNQYCHPTRSFSPCPNFTHESELPRSRQSDQGEWFTCKVDGEGGTVGCNCFAFFRGKLSAVWGVYGGLMRRMVCAEYAISDHTACITYLKSSTQLRDQLFSKSRCILF